MSDPSHPEPTVDVAVFHRAAQSERADLWTMLQAYLLDLSAFDGTLRPRGGMIPYRPFDLYWSDPEHRFPFFICSGADRAGLLLLAEGPLADDGIPGQCLLVAEIYVLPAFRRRGLARSAMRFALDMAAERRLPLVWSCYAENTKALGLYYSFTDEMLSRSAWRPRVADMVDVNGCRRKSFRLDPQP